MCVIQNTPCGIGLNPIVSRIFLFEITFVHYTASKENDNLLEIQSIYPSWLVL